MNRHHLQFSTAAAIMPGEQLSGDLHSVCELEDGMLFAAVDGLGHGSEAALAARTAIETLNKYAHESPVSLIKRCHEALLNTRGAAMSLAKINTGARTLRWIGVGNVEGVLLRAGRSLPNKRLLLRSGVVGYQLPFLQDDEITLNSGDTLILTTDGLLNGFEYELNQQASLDEIAERILLTANKGTDDALVLVVRYGE